MIWIKSVLSGLAAAIIAIIAIAIVTSISIISMSVGGGIGAVSVGLFELLLLPFVLAFAVGFWWMFRRQRRRQSHARVGV